MPFERKDLLQAGLDEMRRLIRQQEPPRPSTRLSALAKQDLTTVAKRRRIEPPKLIHLIRGDLDWIVMKCLEKDRTRRYETASGLTGDLERHLDNETVVARPPSNIYRLEKMFRRNKLVFVAGSAVIGALVLGVGFATWSYIRESRQRQEAEAARQREVKTRQRAEAAEKDQARLRQEAEISQKKAEENAIQVGLALSTSDFLQAVRLIAENRDSDAAAYLARSLRANPGNEAAIARLVTLLSCRSWFLPVMTLQCWPVASAQFSMNGKRILTVETNCAQVWDAQTNQRLIPPIMHDAGWLRFAEFSPDGNCIVTVSHRTARVWDAQTGQAVSGDVELDGGGDFAHFSPDGKRIVTTAWDGFGPQSVRVWDVQTGQPLTGHLKLKEGVTSAQFAPDGKRIVTTASDSTVGGWDAQTGQPLTVPPVHTFGILSAQFDPDGQHIVTVSRDNAVQVWDAQTGQTLTNSLSRFGTITSAEFSPNGKRIVTTSSDNSAKVWDTRTAQPLTSFLVPFSTPQSARFSPDGRRIVTISLDDSLRLWDADTGQPLTEPLKPGGKIQSAQAGPNGKHFATVSGGWVRVWNGCLKESLADFQSDELPGLLCHVLYRSYTT